MRAGVLFSGGKDSTYATYLARQRDEVACLITLSPKREDSWMFHFPNIQWTRLQADAMEVPQVLAETEGVKEEELRDLRSAVGKAVQEHSIEGVYTGALASEYQRSRVEQIAKELGIRCISPLWHVDPETYLRELIKNGFHVIVVGVAALGLDQTWLGRSLDQAMVDELLELHGKFGIHLGLEGGEGETFVLDCPLFTRRIELISTQKLWQGDAGYLLIKDAKLVPK